MGEPVPSGISINSHIMQHLLAQARKQLKTIKRRKAQRRKQLSVARRIEAWYLFVLKRDYLRFCKTFYGAATL